MLYSYISISLCVILAIIGKLNEKKIFNPVISFYALWAFILILNSFHLFGLKETREEINLCILFGVIGFGFGYYLIRDWSRKHCLRFGFGRKHNSCKTAYQYSIRYGGAYVLCAVCLIVSLIELGSMISTILKGGGLALIRYTAQNAGQTRRGFLNAIDILIATPFSMALQPLVAADFWLGKRDRKLLILDIIIITVRVLSNGGRSPIVNLVLHIVIVFTFIDVVKRQDITDRLKKFWKKARRIVTITIIIIIGIAVIIYTTISRESTIKTLYYYFAMEPCMFDYWAQGVDARNLLGYGIASLNGFIFPFLYLLKNGLGLQFPKHWLSIYQLILSTDSQWTTITISGTRANAYVSLFWYFYVDGRCAGVFLGSMLYGLLMSNSFSSVIKKPNIKIICMYSFLLQGLLFSFIRMQTSNLYYAMAIVYIGLVLFKRKKA